MQKDGSPILPLDAFDGVPSSSLPSRIGGKAAGLVWLAHHDFAVPRSWVIDAEHFTRAVRIHLPLGHAPADLLALEDRDEALARMASARDLLLSTPLPGGLRAALARLWSGLRTEAPWGLAVRSSATCEDSELTAMAGLATSVLGVRGLDDLCAAVKRVWASAMLPRALQHLAQFGIRDLSMAVIVQPVVPADASGVMFTRSPVGAAEGVWASDERLVNATFGLGAPVVNGASCPDVVRFAASDGAVRQRTIAAKRSALVVDDRGPTHREVPADRASEPALSRHAERELAELALRLDRVAGVPHDVEFAVVDDEIIVLQARPVVGRGFPEGGDERTVWSRANVGEALPGAATPLTWSVAQDFSEHGFRQAFGSLGCTVPRSAHLVTNVHGRFYLNLTEFMAIASQVPGLEPHTWLEMGGGSGAELLDEQAEVPSRLPFYGRLPQTIARLTAEQASLGRRVARFEREASQRRRQRRQRDLTALSHGELAGQLREVRAELDRTGTLMLACAAASLASHLALRTAFRWLGHEDAERLARAVSAGVAQLESARPGIALAEVAAVARQTPSLAAALAAERYREVAKLPAGAVRTGLAAFFEDHGDRAVREAELATPRWREDRESVFAMLAAAVRSPEDDPALLLRLVRERADAELSAATEGISRWIAGGLRCLVAHSRRTTAWREQMRAWVTRALSDIRFVALEVDRRLRSVDPSLPCGAAFYCTFAELLDGLDHDRLQLSGVVRLRRAEYARDVGRPDPPITFVGRAPSVVFAPAGDEALRGLPASAGVVEGRVRLVVGGRPPTDLTAGDVLVARTTDVGLTPLFLVAAAVVTELGGPLSHASIVAREYGVPAVVNVGGATSALHDGERVRVDGNRGTVERLSKDGDSRGTLVA